MKRRDFIKNVSLASASIPFISNGFGMQAIGNKLFNFSTGAEDRVLVMIRLNGGNDGLNTVIPLDQYANLMLHRSNIILPQNQILSITPEVGLHPSMTGIKTLFDQGKLSIVQNVGYPEQNRSHFRSTDIWSTGSLDVNETKGWLGRYFDSYNPNYPTGYPNATYPDPFAISWVLRSQPLVKGFQQIFRMLFLIQIMQSIYTKVGLQTMEVIMATMSNLWQQSLSKPIALVRLSMQLRRRAVIFQPNMTLPMPWRPS